ncbi:MAG: hypothetical protein D6778_04170, partial [Nitrospirae bacterium]
MGMNWKRHSFFYSIALVIITVLLYSVCLDGEFHFDDLRRIVENPAIRDLKNFWPPYKGRYLVDLTFAINYQIGGLNTIGFHLVNVLIHIINVFLVRTLILKLLGRDLPEADFIAFTGALIFGIHPLQTQAVSYIVQRYASMATMFYLLAMLAYIKWREGKGWPWYGLCLLSLIVGMHSKEIVFSAPFVIVVLEFVFFIFCDRRSFLFLLPVLFTAAIIPLERFLPLLTGHHGTLRPPVVSEEGVYIPR